MDIDSMIYGNLEGDEELMAELLELTAGDDPQPPTLPTKPNPAKQSPAQPNQQHGMATSSATRKNNLDFNKIENLAKQISVDDNDLDDDDDTLMNELNDLVGHEAPESSMDVTPSTLPPIESQAKNELPTPIMSNAPKAQMPIPTPSAQLPIQVSHAQPPIPAPKPEPTESPPKPTAASLPLKEALEQRLGVYKESVQKAQTAGDDRKARQNQRICKQFEDALKALARGKPVDIDSLPKPVGCAEITSQSVPKPTSLAQPKEDNTKSNSKIAALKARALQAKKAGQLEEAKMLLMQAKQLESASSPVEVSPKPQAAVKPQMRRRSSSSDRRQATPIKSQLSPMEMLKEREKFFKNLLQKAQESGDERRVRQHRRIIGMYAEAVSAYRKGSQYDYALLPPPPGKENLNNAEFLIRPTSNSMSSLKQQDVTPPKQAKSRQQEQLEFLLHRQLQFKEAAIMCKQKGDMETAKLFLKQMKGFDPMIEASRNGLPVNISETPIPPQARTSSSALRPQLMTNPEATQASSSCVAQKRDEVLSTLEGDLIRQIQLCDQNQEYFTKAGSVNDVKMFEQLALDTKRDLLTLRNSVARGDRLPPFHYENKQLPVLRYNADLADDEMELNIVRVLTVTLPEGYSAEHADIYVTWELAYPDDYPQKGTTKRAAGSTSGSFNERYKLRINYGAKQFQRLVKRHGVKFEVWQKTGFMRSDKLLGACELKLLSIEAECTLHDSLDLMQGRKSVGGKLEVKVRVRRPMLKNEAKTITQKWLFLDAPTHSQQMMTADIRIPRAVYKNRMQTNV